MDREDMTCGAISHRDGKACTSRPYPGSKRCRDHRYTACCCCGHEDDPNGPGPAVNTGFCAECNAAGCPDRQIGSPCAAGSPF